MTDKEHVLVIPRWVAEWAREDLDRDLLPSDCPPYGYWDRIEIVETRTRPIWRTLQQAVDQAEREDPAVAKAACRLQEAIDEINEYRRLHDFRPLPWDRT